MSEEIENDIILGVHMVGCSDSKALIIVTTKELEDGQGGDVLPYKKYVKEVRKEM